MPAPFIPGLELAGAFFAEVVRPLLAEAFPQLPHAAALLGSGSEVLGYDSARSTDHNWGPRLQIFLAPGDAAATLRRSVRCLPAGFQRCSAATRQCFPALQNLAARPSTGWRSPAWEPGSPAS